MESIGVLIAVGEALTGYALRMILEGARGLTVLGEARTGEEAVTMAAELNPAVILMDSTQSGIDGVRATARAASMRSAAKIIVLASSFSERDVIAVLQAGASGCMSKDTLPESVIKSVRDVHRGRVVISPHSADDRVDTELGVEPSVGPIVGAAINESTSLTAREHSVVRLLARGYSNAEIGAELFLSEATIKANLRRIMRKWGVRDRVQVLLFSLRAGIVSPFVPHEVERSRPKSSERA